MKSEYKNISLRAITILLVLLTIGSFVLPFVLAKFKSFNDYFPNVNFPTYLNGIATPVLYLLTSILLFFSFREQHIANQLLKYQLKQSEIEQERRIMIEEILTYEKYLDKVGVATKKSGGMILQDLACDYINAINHKGELESYRSNPVIHLKEKHTNLYFAITEFERILVKVIQLESETLKKELKLRLYLLFEFYYSGFLSIGLFRSRISREIDSDYAGELMKKITEWRSKLSQ